MDKVLVTGAAGFIGQHTVRLLLSRGYRVRATDLPGSSLSEAHEKGAEVAYGDLMDYRFALCAAEGVGAVVHTAAAFDLSLPREHLIATNIRTTTNMATAAAACGASMFVHYSTCDVFGTKRRVPIMEDEPKQPQCAYSRSKLLSEFSALGVMRKYGMPVAVVRPTFVYGPGSVYTAGSFMILPTLLARRTGQVPLPAGGPRTNTIHVEDMASATLAVLESGERSAGVSYNVADDSDMTACEFLKLIFEPFGVGCSREIRVPWSAVEVVARSASRLPLPLYGALARILERAWDMIIFENELIPRLSPRFDREFSRFIYGEHLYSNARIKSLGWEPSRPTFADGWPATVRWYRENRYIP